MAIAVSIALTFIITRFRYTGAKHTQGSALPQATDQAEIIKRQEKLIAQQQQELQEQYAIAEKQPLGGSAHLASVYQELKQVNQDIEIFLYKAYHNFLGPIATIRGICNVAAMEAKEASSLDYFDKVEAVADNMQSMLEQLLEVSVIHDRELALEPVNLPDFFDRLERELSESTVYTKVRILHKCTEVDHLSIDSFLLRQALIKIVSNTALFRRDSFQDTLELTVLCKEQDDKVVITLKDFHLSIPNEVSPDIFRMFYRGTQQADDHGLGLYTARYAMRRMGGDIGLTSGSSYTSFHLELPRQFNYRYQEFLEVIASSKP